MIQEEGVNRDHAMASIRWMGVERHHHHHHHHHLHHHRVIVVGHHHDRTSSIVYARSSAILLGQREEPNNTSILIVTLLVVTLSSSPMVVPAVLVLHRIRSQQGGRWSGGCVVTLIRELSISSILSIHQSRQLRLGNQGTMGSLPCEHPFSEHCCDDSSCSSSAARLLTLVYSCCNTCCCCCCCLSVKLKITFQRTIVIVIVMCWLVTIE